VVDSNNICSAECVGAFAELQTCWSAGARNALPSNSTLLPRAMNCSIVVLCMFVYADSTVYATLCNDGINTYSALPFLSRNLHRNIRFRRLQMSLGGMAVVASVYNSTNGQPRSHISIPGRGKGVFCSPKCPDRLWAPSSFLASEYRWCFPWGLSGEGVPSTEGNE